MSRVHCGRLLLWCAHRCVLHRESKGGLGESERASEVRARGLDGDELERIAHWPAVHEQHAAFREEAKKPSEEQLAKYRRSLGEHAKEPANWKQNLRYRIGRLLCGRRPFAPHLDREKWETEVRRAA